MFGGCTWEGLFVFYASLVQRFHEKPLELLALVVEYCANFPPILLRDMLKKPLQCPSRLGLRLIFYPCRVPPLCKRIEKRLEDVVPTVRLYILGILRVKR